MSICSPAQALDRARQPVGDELTRPVLRAIAEPEVDVMDLDLPPAGKHHRPGGLLPAADVEGGPLPGIPRIGGDHRIGQGGAVANVLDELACRAAGSELDLVLTALTAAGILLDQMSLAGSLQTPDHAVGVAGEVGEHVADRPSGQKARAAGLLVGQPGNGREQRLVRLAASFSSNRWL